MGNLKLKYEQLESSLNRLYESIIDFDELDKNLCNRNRERVYRTYRDSMIQRFELSIDLFWKYLKKYIEQELKKIIELNSPKTTIREACKIKLISEEDAEKMILMIQDRNMSSHIYKEEMADQIAVKISDYYNLIKKYIDKIAPA